MIWCRVYLNNTYLIELCISHCRARSTRLFWGLLVSLFILLESEGAHSPFLCITAIKLYAYDRKREFISTMTLLAIGYLG
jgi:hypothetical protein